MRRLIGSSVIGSFGPITAVEGLRNSNGSSGTVSPQLGRVRRVVLADADELGRQHRRAAGDLVERELLAGRRRVLKNVPPEHADGVLAGLDGAVAMRSPWRKRSESHDARGYTVVPPANVAPTWRQ